MRAPTIRTPYPNLRERRGPSRDIPSGRNADVIPLRVAREFPELLRVDRAPRVRVRSSRRTISLRDPLPDRVEKSRAQDQHFPWQGAPIPSRQNRARNVRRSRASLCHSLAHPHSPWSTTGIASASPRIPRVADREIRRAALTLRLQGDARPTAALYREPNTLRSYSALS